MAQATGDYPYNGRRHYESNGHERRARNNDRQQKLSNKERKIYSSV